MDQSFFAHHLPKRHIRSGGARASLTRVGRRLASRLRSTPIPPSPPSEMQIHGKPAYLQNSRVVMVCLEAPGELQYAFFQRRKSGGKRCLRLQGCPLVSLRCQMCFSFFLWSSAASQNTKFDVLISKSDRLCTQYRQNSPRATSSLPVTVVIEFQIPIDR